MQLKNLNFIAVIFVCAAIFTATANGQITKSKKAPTKKAIKQTIKQTMKSDEPKIKYTPDRGMLRELQSKVSVVESKKNWAKFNRQRPISNAQQTRSAYIAEFNEKTDDVEYSLEVIVVSDAATGKFYEIRGVEFPRPLENIRWLSNDVLIFDQWLNPHRGGRYTVDFKTGELVNFGFIE